MVNSNKKPLKGVGVKNSKKNNKQTTCPILVLISLF